MAKTASYQYEQDKLFCTKCRKNIRLITRNNKI